MVRFARNKVQSPKPRSTFCWWLDFSDQQRNFQVHQNSKEKVIRSKKHTSKLTWDETCIWLYYCTGCFFYFSFTLFQRLNIGVFLIFTMTFLLQPDHHFCWYFVDFLFLKPPSDLIVSRSKCQHKPHISGMDLYII